MTDKIPPASVRETIKELARNGDIEALIEWTRETPEYYASSDPFDFLFSRMRDPSPAEAAKACEEMSGNFFNNAGYEELQALWKMQARKKRETRQDNSQRAKIRRGALILLMVVGAIALDAFLFSNAASYYRLKAGGVSVTGTVVDIEFRQLPHGKYATTSNIRCPIVAYRDKARHEHRLPYCANSLLKKGETVPILVDPQNDAIAVIDDDVVAVINAALALLLAFLMAVGGLALAVKRGRSGNSA